MTVNYNTFEYINVYISAFLAKYVCIVRYHCFSTTQQNCDTPATHLICLHMYIKKENIFENLTKCMYKKLSKYTLPVWIMNRWTHSELEISSLMNLVIFQTFNIEAPHTHKQGLDNIHIFFKKKLFHDGTWNSWLTVLLRTDDMPN